MEGSGARQAADVKPILKSSLTKEEGRMRGLDDARGHAGGNSEAGERNRLGGDDGGLTGRVIGRSTMEKEDKVMSE